jgi:hypothetical protein
MSNELGMRNRDEAAKLFTNEGGTRGDTSWDA